MNADLLPTKDVQLWLQTRGYLTSLAKIDGIPGPAFDQATMNALKPGYPKAVNWDADRRRTAVEQIMLYDSTKYDIGTIDGIPGPRTEYALELWQNQQRDRTLPESLATPSAPTTPKVIFPRQKDVPSVFGKAGGSQCSQPVTAPYPLRMDGSLSKTARLPLGAAGAPSPINRIALHVNLHDSFQAIMRDVLKHYGPLQIESLGLNQYAGSYNYRPMRGGTSLSMHAYGLAIDFDAQRNSLHETAATARFARPEYKAFIDIFYAYGWISLGRERNFDWMHFQAPRL